jgi:hypothetical protein
MPMPEAAAVFRIARVALFHRAGYDALDAKGAIE